MAHTLDLDPTAQPPERLDNHRGISATPVMVRWPVGVRTRLTELADRLAVSCPSSIR
jgi:hypothetical protein